MLVKDLSSIRIAGRCFGEDCILKLFPNDGHRLSFVFGGNGSGKSTISNAFLMGKNGDLPEGITDFSLLGLNEAVLDDEAKILKRTHVFNERFIEDKVRVTGDGLKSIVMFGEAGELTDKITEATGERNRIDAELQDKEAELSAYNDPENPISPEYWDREVVNALGGIGRWNEREKRIRQLQRNAAVNANIIEDIKRRSVSELPRDEIERELDEGIERVVELSEGESLPAVPMIPSNVNQFSETAVIELLAKEIQKPVLSEREKRLLAIAQAIGTSRLSESRDYFSKGGSGYCPYCFRDMDIGEADDLVKSIGLVLNEEAENHKIELSKIAFPKLSLDLGRFTAIGEDIVQSCELLVDKTNSLLGRYEELVMSKAGSLYTPIVIEPLGVSGALTQLSAQLGMLEELRLDWNKAVEEKNDLVVRLQELNKILARLDIDQPMSRYSEFVAAKQKAEARATVLRREHELKCKEIEGYEAQKSNIKVALDRINSALAFVFLDKEHLVLQGSGGEYRLLSHGTDVRPQDVSTGERNAIALCYFFTLIGEGKKASDIFNEEMLLVLDDPISSFDQENRIGMLSYLREQFKAVLSSNTYSKIICLTHDGYTMNAFDRVSDEIKVFVQKRCPNKPMKKPDRFILVGGKLSSWSLSNMRYGDMLRAMYEYSLSPADDLRPYMGNVARRALEAFSTFEFNLGVSAFADSPEVFCRIPSDCRRAYFSNLMFHLVLHSESHTEDVVKLEGLVETMPEYMPDTIDRIIRDTLCLIYSLNRGHVLTHLAECESPESNIERWIVEIETTLDSSLENQTAEIATMQ